LCLPTVNCSLGKVQGEWTANGQPAMLKDGSTTFGGMARPAERGRFDLPLPKGPGEGAYALRLTFPWKRIVDKSWEWIKPTKRFNKTSAEDPANIKWEISTWFNTLYPVGTLKSNDHIDPDGRFPKSCLEITDVLPNSGNLPSDAAGGSNSDFCHRLANRLERCKELVTSGSQMDYDVCKPLSGTKTPADKIACENAGCFWYDANTAFPCQLKMPIMDFDKPLLPDGTGGGDFNILKREFGRPLGY
jgi:hypothetical protein